MDSDRRQVVALAVIGFLVSVALVASAAHIAGTLPITGNGDVTIQANDGLEVTVTGNPDIDLSDPWTLGGTIDVITESGNATIYSSGPSAATIHKSEIEGTWTNATAIDADPNAVEINPADKSKVTVAQQITSISFKGSVAADDGTVDFAYSSNGPGEVTLTNAPASTDLYAINDSGYILDKASSDKNGVVTFDALETGTQDASLQTNVNDAPTQANASPQGKQSQEPTQLSVDVSDPNFDQGDTVDVKINFEGTQVHSETISSNQTVTTSVPADGTLGGSHSWSVDTTDDYGGSVSKSYSYSVPSNLTFRTEQQPHDVIKGTSTNPIVIEAIFYEDKESAPTIINRTTTDGTIDLDGLPVSSEFSISVKAPGHYNRTVRLEDIYSQSDVYLIEKDGIVTVENRFVVTDRTGEFPAGEMEISIQGPINESLYDPNANGYKWKTVSGDDLGADEAFVDDLVEGKRYRIIVENNEGDQRNLGSYTPETTGTIELTIGSITVDTEEYGGVGINSTWYNESGTERVRVSYNDTEGATDTLYVDIYERNNKSNVLLDNASFAGPFGTFSHTEDVPAGEEDTTWVVEVRGDRSTDSDGQAVENVHSKQYVGPSINVLTALPNWLVTVIFVGSIWGVAGLFSQVNGHVGGLVVAGMAGMFFFAGVVPAYLGGGVVALAMLTAGVLFIRGSSGAI